MPSKNVKYCSSKKKNVKQKNFLKYRYGPFKKKGKTEKCSQKPFRPF